MRGSSSTRAVWRRHSSSTKRVSRSAGTRPRPGHEEPLLRSRRRVPLPRSLQERLDGLPNLNQSNDQIRQSLRLGRSLRSPNRKKSPRPKSRKSRRPRSRTKTLWMTHRWRNRRRDRGIVATERHSVVRGAREALREASASQSRSPARDRTRNSREPR